MSEGQGPLLNVDGTYYQPPIVDFGDNRDSEERVRGTPLETGTQWLHDSFITSRCRKSSSKGALGHGQTDISTR
jgi:hypothetical protein